MRRTLTLLVLAVAIAVGLWYWLTPADSSVVAQPGTAEPAVGATPATGDSQTAGSGIEPATDAENPIDTDTASPAGVTQTADSGVTPRTGDPQATDSGTASAVEVAQTTDPGATPRTDDTPAAASDTTSQADVARMAESGATTGSTPRGAAAEPADPAVPGKAVLSAVPEGTIEQVPIDAPDADEPGQTDLLAAVERLVEQVEATIREQLTPEPGGDADTKLRVQIEYDDSQGDAAQVGVESNEAARTADSDATPPVRVADATDADTATPTVALRTTDSDAAPSADAARTAEADATEAEATEAEAKQYVEMLTATTPRTIPVDKADHFVTQEHVLSLVPEDMIESVSVGELAKDDALAAETPVTVVREVEQIETAAPEQLIAEFGGDLDTRLRVLVKYDDSSDDAEQNVAVQSDTERGDAGQGIAEEGGAGRDDAGQSVAGQTDAEQGDTGQTVAPTVEQITVREALERLLAEPEKPISVIRTVRYFEVMTLRELLDTEEDADTFLNVITRPYRLEAATLADLLRRQKTENPDSIFYLHTVQPTDEQGIWGIVHFGLIDNFARGMAVRRGEDVETYTVRIPRDADERLYDRSSSFLGKLIDRKTKESYVYNFRDDRMGRSPDRVYPGQEIVIINFQPEELVSIYKHFASG